MSKQLEAVLSGWRKELVREGAPAGVVDYACVRIKNCAASRINQLGVVFALGCCEKKEIDAINQRDPSRLGLRTELLFRAVCEINRELREVDLHIGAQLDPASCSGEGRVIGQWVPAVKPDKEAALDVIEKFAQQIQEDGHVPDTTLGVVLFRAKEKVVPLMDRQGQPFNVFQITDEEADYLTRFQSEKASIRTKLMIDLLWRIDAKAISCDLKLDVTRNKSGSWLVATWEEGVYG